MNADRDAISRYTSQPNETWDSAVPWATVKGVRVPPIPKNHYLTPELQSHPDYAKTRYTTWALKGKSNNQLGAATGLPRELTDEISRLAEKETVAARRALLDDIFEEGFDPRFNWGTPEFDAQIAAALAVGPAPYRVMQATTRPTVVGPLPSGLRQRTTQRVDIELQEMY